MSIMLGNLVTTPPADGCRGTPGRLIKVDHAGEFTAINIYRAQICLARFTAPELIPELEHFLEHERRHLEIFERVLVRRGIRRCKSYWFCGVGGYCLGLATGLFGKAGIMACTAAVETVVLEHLDEQMSFMQGQGDLEARDAVRAIVEEEREHQHAGVAAAKNSILYRPLCAVISWSTEVVIWLGVKL